MKKVVQNIQNEYIHNVDMKESGKMPIIFTLRNSPAPKILAER
ncbi:Uncharacterised protein [uncultured archaeon]|nr:Uncharacterised protein [uncultured archaeon]